MVYRVNTKAKLKAGILLFDYKDIVRKNLMRIFLKKRKVDIDSTFLFLFFIKIDSNHL